MTDDRPAGRLPDDPREFHGEAAFEQPVEPIAATPWRVEEWRGKYLVVREQPSKKFVGALERQVDAPNPFSSFATIYEDEDSAQSRAEVLNKESENGDV